MDGGEQVATDSKTVVGVSSTMGSNPILSATLLGNGLLNGLQAGIANRQGGVTHHDFYGSLYGSLVNHWLI